MPCMMRGGGRVQEKPRDDERLAKSNKSWEHKHSQRIFNSYVFLFQTRIR